MRVFSIDGHLYRVGMWLYNFMYLNILFILCCIPIITIFPALAALFGVVRQWRQRKEVAVFSQFKTMFIENWKQSYFVGILFTFISLVLVVDFLFINQMASPYKIIIYVATVFVSFLFVLSFLSIYPLMVNMITTFKRLCISSLQVGLYKIHLTIFCMIILGAWTILSLRFSFLIFFFFFSVSAYLIYWIADLKFAKLIPQESSES
ncbi:YesL family protein [Peribacillus loiseleuriae]|uniref:YesL family protein n=1 Tax=Peribacillus loiseleuriae TaxID=1679170 RepID=UPI003CFC28AA